MAWSGSFPVMRELARVGQRMKPFFAPPDPQLVLRRAAGWRVVTWRAG